MTGGDATARRGARQTPGEMAGWPNYQPPRKAVPVKLAPKNKHHHLGKNQGGHGYDSCDDVRERFHGVVPLGSLRRERHADITSGWNLDLALWSHLLFTYSGQLSADFHGQAVFEMCRVARDVQVVPLLDPGGQPSPHVEPVCQLIREHDGLFLVESVAYRFQRGGNRMLRFSH